MKCKEWWNGGMCSKKLNFMLRLPFNVIENISLAQRLATVILCKGCSQRMFVLPEYACRPESVKKYQMYWRNGSVLSKLLGNGKRKTPAGAEMPLLMAVLRRKR